MRSTGTYGVRTTENTAPTHICLQLQVRLRRGREGRGGGSGYPMYTFGRPFCCPGNETGGRKRYPPQWCPDGLATVLKKKKIS